MKKRLFLFLAALFAIGQVAWGWSGSGTQDNPYLISNSSDWNKLSEMLNEGNVANGVCVKLIDNISVDTSIGTLEHPFEGNFDGENHTITVNLSGDDFTAPFSFIRNTTISHLHVDGRINGGIHAAGLAGHVVDKSVNTITDCRVSANIAAKSTHAGGFVGHANSSTITIEGCLFDGDITSPNNLNFQFAGIFFGWSENTDGLTLKDCFAKGNVAGQHVDLSWKNWGTASCGTVNNTYSDFPQRNLTLGKKALFVKTANPVIKLHFTNILDEGGTSGPITTFKTSNLVSYGVGLTCGDEFMTGEGQVLVLYISAEEGFSLAYLYADSGTLAHRNDVSYRLALGSSSVIINAKDISSYYSFNGQGTLEEPYLISSNKDWLKLVSDLAHGNTYKDKVLRLENDIDANGLTLGSEENPFCGTFDGDGHTITLNRGTFLSYVSTGLAPFEAASGAIIRHLYTAGTIYSNAKYTAGIVSKIKGQQASSLYDCHSSIAILSNREGDTANGGLVGGVEEGTDSLVINRCSFTGALLGYNATNCGGFVGWSDAKVKISQSIFCPNEDSVRDNVTVGATFACMSDYSQLTLENCYATRHLQTAQGTFVLSEVKKAANVNCEFLDEPYVNVNGKSYYTNGCRVKLSIGEGSGGTGTTVSNFNYWKDPYGCFISDPMNVDGIHILNDMKRQPFISNATDAAPSARLERELEGTRYRYLTRADYHLYMSDEHVAAKGYEFENGDADAYLLKKIDGTKCYITAVTGVNVDDIPNDGAQIHNDLAGFWRDHTLLGCIAPRAFKNCSGLKTLYFKDTDANNYNTLAGFDFFIGEQAFANCPNFKELKMMQYTTRGDNHWEGLIPDNVSYVPDDAFDGSNQLKISARVNIYQLFLSSPIWEKHYNRFIIYEATNSDFTVDGVKYRWYRDVDTEDNNGVKNDAEGKAEMMKRILPWNSMYQDFSAATLLETEDNCNVYYAYVVGVDNSKIDNANGTMRIYNDPGSNYNYKAISMNRTAIAGNTHVKNIEFWQTNGNGENSYSDLKFVIPNGAFKGCTNLKELRMFYFVQDGDDHWETLGPKDVIPGDNIFGTPSLSEIEKMSAEEGKKALFAHKDFKILVSPDLYTQFLEDPNWQHYAGMIEPVDYEPTNKKKDFTEDGLTYSYMTSPGGILQTSQVVSQDVSWWTAPRIIVEVIILLATIGSSFGSSTAAASQQSAQSALEAAQVSYNNASTNFSQAIAFDAAFENFEHDGTVRGFNIATGNTLLRLNQQQVLTSGALKTMDEDLFEVMVEFGLADAEGIWQTEAAGEFANQLIDGTITTTEEKCIYFLKFLSDINNHIIPYANALKLDAWAALQTAQRAHAAATAAALNAVKIRNLFLVADGIAAVTGTSAFIASQCWGGSGSYNGEKLKKGMRENILSNIHQVGLVGGGYVITTPQKNLVYHTYVKEVSDKTTDAVIYAGFDNDNNVNSSNRTMALGKKAFRNKTNLKTVKFHDISNQSSNTGMPMLITIPDSAFVGCTALTEFSTLLQTKSNGTRALGPENFIFGGDSIFAGLDSLKFHIVIDPTRKQDFLDNASWAHLKRFFTYQSAVPENKYREYGVNYAYAYEQNSIKKQHKVMGHLIEHTIVTGPDNDFITNHQGAVKLCNDIGRFNNYQLDMVMPQAFKGNKYLRSVSFTDLYGLGAFGDSYTGLQMHLGDSAFVDCTNLANLDLLYMVTDGTNHIDPITPNMLTIGKGVFDGTSAKLKMMPQQVKWFEADSSWVAYKDRFMPCVVRFSDPGVRAALKDMAYYDPANTGADQSTWDDYCDLARIAGAGFSWLDGKFTKQKDDIYSFADFKWFESVGLDYVGDSWFDKCSKLGNIVLPSTIKTIKPNAFRSCFSLTEIELPANVSNIGERAFDACTSLNTIVVRAETPADLGLDAFHKHDGLKIYVPAGKVDTYKEKWSTYAPYIVGDDTYKINKVVTVTAVGQLASKLGLKVVKERSKVRYIEGPYAKYDSLTVIGPINGEDIAVMRHMAGADAYDSDPTDGCLRYLNLWNAQIKKDGDNSYNGNWSDEYIDDDNKVPDYMFENCATIETVIFPHTATFIGENIFEEATAMRQVCVGRSTTEYSTDLLQDTKGLEELAMITSTPAKNNSFWSDPWEAPIQIVWSLPSQIGDYLGDPKLTRRAQNITAPLSSDEVMLALAGAGHFFPTEYLELENVEGIFNGNADIKVFNDFYSFQKVISLDSTFCNMANMTSIKLPNSIERISEGAFSGCTSLNAIYVGCDSVPELAKDAFESLPNDFCIYVPKRLCKLYRTKWEQYAEHINPDNSNSGDDDVLIVEVTEPNTLAEKLGLVATKDINLIHTRWVVTDLKGDYSKVRRLKVIGPISGADFDVMRYLAGYCPWSSCRNYSGQLEYIDLYDAQIRQTDVCIRAQKSGFSGYQDYLYKLDDDVLPHHAFLKAYKLKTLIIPKTCKKVEERALQECEALEALTIGDDCAEFNWNALDDDVMLTRMYILAKKKVEISMQNKVWRGLCNNYNPTFDAFYVLPSLYEDYLYDDAYTGSSWQRTNNISKADFEEDASFRYFASHAAATKDDLSRVYSIKGWSNGHEDVKDLTYLGHTAINTLRAADMQPLTQLEKVILPVTLETIEDSVFAKSPNLRYVDMMMCDSTIMVDDIKTRGLAKLGIDSLQTLTYLPKDYGQPKGVNIIVSDGVKFSAETFRLVDKDYCVPYTFTASHVTNERQLAHRAGQDGSKYTVCLPYSLSMPSGAKAYKLEGRSGGTLTFKQETGYLEALVPYLVVVRGQTATLSSDKKQEIPNTLSAIFQTGDKQIDVPGYTLRGTMKTIDYKMAAELGAYILQASDNKWHLVKNAEGYENANIPALRTYLLQNGGTGANSLSMELLDEFDGIDTIRTIDNDGTERYYDINGRELPCKPNKGIYIHNGKKYVSK